jgi:hypothetical protein
MIALLDSVSCRKGTETRPTGMQSLLQADARVAHVPESRRLALTFVSPSQEPRPPTTKHVLHVKSWMTVGWLFETSFHELYQITFHCRIHFFTRCSIESLTQFNSPSALLQRPCQKARSRNQCECKHKVSAKKNAAAGPSISSPK